MCQLVNRWHCSGFFPFSEYFKKRDNKGERDSGTISSHQHRSHTDSDSLPRYLLSSTSFYSVCHTDSPLFFLCKSNNNNRRH